MQQNKDSIIKENPFLPFPYTEFNIPDIDHEFIKNEPSFKNGFHFASTQFKTFIVDHFYLIQKGKYSQLRNHIISQAKKICRKNKNEPYMIYGIIDFCAKYYDIYCHTILNIVNGTEF